MARDPLDDLLDDITPAEGDSVATTEDEEGDVAPVAADPLDDLLADLEKKPAAAGAPSARPVRPDFQWGTLYDVPPEKGGWVKPPPAYQPKNDLEAGLQQVNSAMDMGPKPPPFRDAMDAPPPLPGPPLGPSLGRMSPQKWGKISGHPLPEQSRAMKILEPVMRPVVGFGAGGLQTAQNVVQLMGAGWGKKPIFNSKTFIRDLETAGVYGEAGFWARNSEKAGDLGSQLAFMGGLSGALIKGGVPEFIAQQAGMGAVAATAAAAEAQNSGEKLTGDQWASLTIENLVTYPLFAHGVGSLAKTALAGSKYAKAITPAVSAAATGAAFEGLPEPAPGESRLENMLVGAFTFGLDASIRHNFPGMTRSFRERGAKKQTGFAAEALEATTNGKRTPAEDAALELKTAHSRAEEFVLNFIAQSRLAGLDPYQKGASHALSPEMVATAARIDPITAQQIIARHRAVKNDVTKEITTNMVKERVVELARTAGGEKQAQEARYRLGMMDPFEARRYQTSDRGEGSEIGYQKANQKQTGALMKEARESLKAEFLDQFRAQATGALEESQLRAGNEAEQARVARFADESRQDAIIRTAREDQARAEQLRKEVAVEDARARGIQPPPVGPTVAPPPSPVGAEPPVTTRARMLERATARGEAEPGMKRFRLDEATDADVAAMEGELAPPPAPPPSPAEQLRTQIQAREFGPKFGGTKPPPVAGRQEPPPPGARAATKYRKTGAPTNLPTGERAAESRLVPTRPKRLPKKKAQRALNKTVRRLAPTEVAGPLREIPAPPPVAATPREPLRAAPKQTERTEFGKVRAAFKGRGESPPPVKAAAPPEPPKVAPVAEQPKPEAPPVEKKPGKPPKPAKGSVAYGARKIDPKRVDKLGEVARKAFDAWDEMDPNLRPDFDQFLEVSLRKAKSSTAELRGMQLEQHALEQAGLAPNMGRLNRSEVVAAARAQNEVANDELYMDERIRGMLGGNEKEYEGMTTEQRNRKVVEKFVNQNWDSIFASAPEAIDYLAKKYGREFGPMVEKAVDAATRPVHEVSADIEKNSMPREKRAVTRAKVILGDKADKSPEAGPSTAKDRRVADKLADAVERHNQREEVEEKTRNRQRKGGRKGDSGKYIAYGLAGAVAGTILASDDEEAKKVALAGLPFVIFPRGRKPQVGRLKGAERASAEAWARTPLDRGPLRPGPMDTPEGARLAMNGQPGPRRIESIIDQIFPEIGVGEDRIFRPVEQPSERKVQYQKSDLEPDLGREHLFQGSDAPGVTAPHQPNLITRKLQSASHALTGFGAPGEALNRGVNFVEQAVNTRAGRLLFEYKRILVEAQEKAGLKDDFTRTMNAKETKHFEAFWEHVVSGKPMPKDVQENANTKVRVIADWASRMIDGRRVAGLTKEESIVSDALTKFWSDQLASTAVEATDTIKHWVEMPMYGLPVVIAPEALTPEPRKIGRLGVRAWQEKYERAQALQEKIIDEAIEARPDMTRAQVRDHLSKMSGMAEDPLFNISIGEPEASHANFLDRHRLLDVKSGRVLDPVKLFDMYFPNIIRRVEMARMWGGDMELARDIMDVAKGDRQNTDAMATLFDIASNQAPKTTSQALNNLSALVSVKSLGRAGIRQLSTWANEMKYPVRYRDGLRAMNDSFRYAVSESHLPKEFRKKFYNEEHDLFVHEMGTAMRNEYSHVLSSLSGIIGKGTHMLLKYPYLVTPLDRLPRLKASMWARRSIHALIPEIEHAIRSGQTTRFGNKNYYQDVARELWQDPAVQKIALKPTHTAAEIEALKINAAEWLVARTNGRSEPRDMPAVMQHPIGKEMFKFQQFNLRATAEFHREWNFTDPKSTVRNKAAQMKLFAGTAASLGLGYGIYRALAALRKDENAKDDPLSHQIIETMAGAGMYSSLIAAFDIFSGSYGRDAGEKILGATLGTAADAGQAAYRTGATGKSDAARSFMIQNMPEPFWGPWFGIPARSDLRQDEKERRKVEKRRESSGY